MAIHPTIISAVCGSVAAYLPAPLVPPGIIRGAVGDSDLTGVLNLLVAACERARWPVQPRRLVDVNPVAAGVLGCQSDRGMLNRRSPPAPLMQTYANTGGPHFACILQVGNTYPLSPLALAG